jgi:hypothetical protein
VTAALMVSCTACRSNHNLYPVAGMVTYNGAPASGAVISFYRRDGDSADHPPILGIVQEDGSFELVCGALGKGAPPGNYAVLIEWKRAASTGKGRPQIGLDRLKGRYADRNRPLLHATVAACATSLPPFELIDAISVPKM